MAPRLMLLEFLFADRYSQFRSKNYPFLLGQARELGVEATWLCCWAPQVRDSRTRYVMDLDDDSTSRLIDAIEQANPTRIISSEKLGNDLAKRFSQRLGQAIVYDLSAAPIEHIVTWPASWLPRWLALDKEDESAKESKKKLVDVATPEYESTCLPPPGGAAEPAPPPVHIVAGPECIYRKPLSRNRSFRGVTIPDGVRPFGCSFCAGPLNVRYPFETPPVELAMRQCLAALRSNDRCSSRQDYVIDGGHLALEIAGFLKEVLSHPFPPSRFFFSFRIDELLSVASRLEEVLPELAHAGHCIEIYNMGVENFSPRENERLNKGLRPEQIEHITELTARWESTYPGTFVFGGRGGFGLILFTPWTTLDDLELNLVGMRRHGVDAQGFGLTSKLQILPETAIAAMARQDGVLDGTFEVFHYYDSGCFFRWDQRELPWRFRSRLVAHLYAIACRIAPITTFDPDDRLFQRVQDSYEAHQHRGGDPISFFALALVSAGQITSPSSPEEILDRVESAERQSSDGSTGVDESTLTPNQASIELAAELTALIGRRGQGENLLSIAGFAIVSIKPLHTSRQALLELRSADERLELFVHRHEDQMPHFVSAGPYTISFSQQTPLTTGESQRAVHAFAELLRRAVTKRA